MLLNMTIGEPKRAKKWLVIGDSTMAANLCRGQSIADKLFTPLEIAAGYSAVSIAVPGHRIADQLAAYNALPDKTIFDGILIQVGLNNMALGPSISEYQAFVNHINSTKRADAEIIVSCMLLCRQRWSNLGILYAHDNCLLLNEAINGLGPTPITGVTKRNNYHVALLNDGFGNLADQYQCPEMDEIHENQVGADIMIYGYRLKIFG